LLVAAGGCRTGEAAGDASGQGPWAALVAAENAFAARAEQMGISPAFLEVLAEEGVVFAPGPVRGRTRHRESPSPREAYLRWHPRVAAVSGAGDLGYTSGPWVAGRGSDPPGAAGHYVSLWGRAGDRWELLVDVGTSHPPLDDQQVRRAARELPEPGSPPGWTAEEARRTLGQRQGLFRLVLALDAAVHLASLVAPDARVYLEGEPPTEGGLRLAGLMETGRAWSEAGSGVASSLDLAWAYGTHTRAGVAGAGNFLEIWAVRDGAWQLVLFLLQEP